MTTDRNPANALESGLAAARRLGASAAKLHLSRSHHIRADFENARLKDTSSVSREGYAIEVLVEGRRGNTSGTAPADLDELVARAVALAKVGGVAHFDAYPAPAETAAVKMHSSATASLPRERLIGSVQQMIDDVKGYEAELFLRGSAGRSESDDWLATSGGLSRRSRSTFWFLSCRAQRTRGTDMLFAGEHRYWRDMGEFYDPAFIASAVIDDLRRAEATAEPPSGRTTALLHPRILGMLLEAVAIGVNGRNVAKGDSPLRGRLGERVLDPAISITDDPHVDYAPGAAEVDHDGVPTRKVDIVKAGVLKCFLYDLDSAGLAGAAPTGHRACRPHFAQVAPGQGLSDDLLASIDDGVYVKDLIGFGQSNLINGDFSANVALGYRVRGGEVVGRVKNAMIAGNVYELLGRDVRLSADRDPLTRIPYAVVKGLNCSGATG